MSYKKIMFRFGVEYAERCEACEYIGKSKKELDALFIECFE